MTTEFDAEEFRKILAQKEEDINVRTHNEIQDHESYKKLHVGLISFHKKNAINDFIAILIKKEEVEKFNISSVIKIPLNINMNYHLVNRNFEILKSEKKELNDETNAEAYYKELSKEFCVFLVTPEGINPFVDGQNIGKLVFYKKKEYRSYRKLAEITELDELFQKYRRHITYRYNYDNFFVSKSAKRALFEHLYGTGQNNKKKEKFVKENAQLLQNKPEDRFRESLRIFLKTHLRRDILFGKEYILENFKRLDINIYDDFGDLYFIEVKWVGKSVHAEGNVIETEYTSDHINPAALEQSIEYIKALYEDEQNIKIGYLAVFDARYEDLPDTMVKMDVSNIPVDDRKFLEIFRKIPDFRVLNNHPN